MATTTITTMMMDNNHRLQNQNYVFGTFFVNFLFWSRAINYKLASR